MPAFQKFEDIEAWQKARELAQEVYRISSDGVFSRDFGLRDQMRRASVSIMSNIAEGFERSGTGELMQFLSMAKGSTGEVKSQLYVAHDQKYINQELFDKLFNSSCEISKMINGLMNYIRSSKIKGIKYKHTNAPEA